MRSVFTFADFFNILFPYLFFYQEPIAGCWIAYDMFIVILLLSLQNYIGEKVGPDEKLRWAQSVIRRGFTGEV